jgi:hypothetical protein
MDRLREFLKLVADQGVAAGNFLGLLHILIGRRITLTDGTDISGGLTWRELAILLKKVRWDPHQVAELGLDASIFPPRDRERYWYTAIAQAQISSPLAVASGDRLRDLLLPIGYIVSPSTPPAKEQACP